MTNPVSTKSGEDSARMMLSDSELDMPKALSPQWPEFDDAMVASVGEFLRSCTIPLVFEEGDTSFIHGTGCFFQGVESLYLITASHVLSSIDPAKLGVPKNPIEAHSFTFGQVTVNYPTDEKLDVAVVRIEDPDFPNAVAANWRVLDPKNVLLRPAECNRFIVAGYPTQTALKEGDVIRPKPLQLYTTRYTEQVDGGLGPFDFALAYAREANDVKGRAIATPKVEGVSGAAVWGLASSTPEDIWTPESQLKLVGVQSSYVHSKYIRAKSWTLILEVFRRIDPATFEAIVNAH